VVNANTHNGISKRGESGGAKFRKVVPPQQLDKHDDEASPWLGEGIVLASAEYELCARLKF
jgi:hypothetical protein